MTVIRVQRLTIQEQGTDVAEAQRLGRRVAELLGEALVTDPATVPASVRSQPRAVVEVQQPAGLTGDQLAAYIARQVRARLG